MSLHENYITDLDTKRREKLTQSVNNSRKLSKYFLDVFVCRNSEIISLLGRCNNVSDCLDDSDEENCTDTTGTYVLIRV